MSYMTDILNSMSMKVSSGYEILSFRMHWKRDKEIIFSHFYHSGPCTFASVRACVRGRSSKPRLLIKGTVALSRPASKGKEATKRSRKQLRSADRGQAVNGRARSKSPDRVAQELACLTRMSEIRPGAAMLQFSPWGILAGTAQTPRTHCTRTWQCRRTWSGCSNQSSAAGVWGGGGVTGRVRVGERGGKVGKKRPFFKQVHTMDKITKTRL